LSASVLAAAIARAQSFLLEPPSEVAQPAHEALPAAAHADGVQTAVLGLSRGCGASTVAQGLVAALAASRGDEAQLIVAAPPGGRVSAAPPAGGRRWEVPYALNDPAETAEYGAMAARLAGGASPRGGAVVWDVGCDGAGRSAHVVRSVDVVVAVAAGDAEPALAGLVCQVLAERNERVMLVANRVRDPERWSRWANVCLPEARLGSLLLARGRRPGGPLWTALERLSDGVTRAAANRAPV
jgi:hypothetical protein